MNIRPISKFWVVFFLGICLNVSAQLEIIITKIPASTPQNSLIYLAGNFNNWNPGQNNYKLIKNAEGQYTITLQLSPGQYQFKFTRGSWATVEGNASGMAISNRVYNYTGGKKTLNLEIAGWEDATSGSSTASPQVSVLSDAFYIPQLNKDRKIWIYLPKDYVNSTKKYPVIYMHDGQNLFDNQTSFAGEWRVDEALDSLFLEGDYGAIVVGIENGGADRIEEYTPWPHPSYGGGDGDEYLTFIEENLKPYVDSVYRTLPGKKFTAIAGSSLGGFISHYAGIRFQNAFGKIGSLSTSYWFSDSLYTIVSKAGIQDNTYFYMSTGTEESTGQVGDMLRMADTLKKYGLPEAALKLFVIQGGKHNEALWAREFPKMYQWFWKNEDFTSAQANQEKNPNISIYRQGDSMLVLGDFGIDYSYTIFDVSGAALQFGRLESTIPLRAINQVSPLVFSVFKDQNLILSKILP